MHKHLVIGCRGQVGAALMEVLSAEHDVTGIDQGDFLGGKFDVIHIAIPFNERFERNVCHYRELFLAKNGLLIIHSTVAVGTSAKFDAVHTPIRGVHPNLAGGIRTFEKFFGGPRASEAAAIFEVLGVRTVVTDKAENTEALKLWDTTYYGWNIVFEKAVKQYCAANGLDFDIVYTRGNKGYNEGYAELGRFDVLRPVLGDYPGKIGGHCVVPNARILASEEGGNEVAEFILKKDSEY